MREAAERLSVTVVPLLTDRTVNEDTYRRIFASLADNPIDAPKVVATPQNTSFKETIVGLANEAHLPAIYDRDEYVEIGGLMSYGPSYADLNRRAAVYVDKILKGADPAELPIQQPAKFDFVINLKTARELGITIPPAIMIQATELIE